MSNNDETNHNTSNTGESEPNLELVRADLTIAQQRCDKLAAQIAACRRQLLAKRSLLEDLHDTRASTDRREEIVVTIDSLMAEVEDLKQRHAAFIQLRNDFAQQEAELLAANQESVAPMLTSPVHLPTPSQTPASTIRPNAFVPSNLPSFRHGPNPVANVADFTNLFELQLRAYGLEFDEHWSRLLPLSLSVSDYKWCRKHIQETTSWRQARAMLLEQFGNRVNAEAAALQLQTLAFKPNESILDFSERFQALMEVAGVENDSVHALAAYKKALPSIAAGHLQAAITNHHLQENTVSTYAKYATTFQSIVDQSRETTRTTRHLPRGEESSASPLSSSTHTKDFKRHMWCSIHKAKSHNTSECRSLKSRIEGRGPTPSTGKDTKPTIKRVTVAMKPSPTLPSIPSTKLSSATVDVPVSESKTTVKTIKLGKAALPAARDMKNLKPFEIPILVNGTQQFALVDSGAECSFISQDLVDQLGISYTPYEGQIQLADPDYCLPRIGVTEPINFETQHQVFTQSCEILTNTGFPPVLLGEPAITRFGFDSLTSSYKYPDPNPPPKQTEPEEPFEEQTPQEVNMPEFINQISDLLDINNGISHYTFCPIPEAQIHLPTEPGKTAYKRQFPIAHVHRPQITDEIKKWLERGVIEPAPLNSTFNTPIFAVPKKDAAGEMTLQRLCLDFRALNKLIPDDLFPIPLISDIFEALAGAKIFTTLDLQSAYHRFPIAPEDRYKTAFTWEGAQYVFRGAPFGLKNLPSVFQRVMVNLLSDLPFVRTYFDDIVIFSTSYEEHIQHVRQVIERLNTAQLILNVPKCHFAQPAIDLLGFRITAAGHEVNRTRLVNVQAWPRPQTIKQLQHYLGFYNYFREHIPLASSVTAPLDAIRNANDIQLVWSPVHDAAFDNLKGLLLECLPLDFPDFTKEFVVATDASNNGIGAVLYQLADDGTTPKYISFQASSLTASQKNYSATKRELLAVIFALKRFHSYLWGRKFTLYTDHAALTYLHTQPNLNPMLIGWHEIIADYRFDIFHRPGIKNILPDHLSRFFDINNDMPNEPSSLIMLRATALLDTSAQAYIAPPENQRAEILEKHHLLGHFGANSVVDAIHDAGFHWKYLKQQALDITSQCQDCMRFNIAKHGYHPLSPIAAANPFDHIAVDLAGPFPTSSNDNHYLLVLVDVHSRFVVLRAIRNKSMVTVGNTLVEIFCQFGFPKIIQSDNGTEFVNQVIKHLTNTAMMDHRLTTPYHPRANGLAERTVQTSTKLIKKLLHGAKKYWDSHLPFVQYAINVKFASIHKSTPFSVMFGRKHNAFTDYEKIPFSEPIDDAEIQKQQNFRKNILHPAILTAMESSQAKTKAKFDSTHRLVGFTPGSYVRIRNKTKLAKLDEEYDGPFKIIHRTAGGSYVLEDYDGKLLANHFPPHDLDVISGEPKEKDKSYEVEKIITHRKSPDGFEYLVRWKGYTSAEDSWEPSSNFDSLQTIRNYWDNRK